MKKINLRIWLPDFAFLTVSVESWTTADEVEQMVATKLSIKNRKPFRLFEESTEEGTERLLRPEDR